MFVVISGDLTSVMLRVKEAGERRNEGKRERERGREREGERERVRKRERERKREGGGERERGKESCVPAPPCLMIHGFQFKFTLNGENVKGQYSTHGADVLYCFTNTSTPHQHYVAVYLINTSTVKASAQGTVVEYSMTNTSTLHQCYITVYYIHTHRRAF